MECIRACFLRFCKTEVFSEAEFIATVRPKGIEARPLEAEPESVPLIVVFSELTVQLCDVIRTTSSNGLRRVVALALSRSALNHGESWRLLEAGASDVLAWDQ